MKILLISNLNAYQSWNNWENFNTFLFWNMVIKNEDDQTD